MKIGDRVSVLDDNLSGYITSIGKQISVLIDDGFEMEFEPSELVVEHGVRELKSMIHPDKETILEKNVEKRPAIIKSKSKERNKPEMVIDLHIHQLVKSTKGMNAHDMLLRQLDTAKYHLELAISKRMQKIVFIHGVGEGVLRSELEYLFRQYEYLNYYDANYQEFGLGAVEVYIPQKATN